MLYISSRMLPILSHKHELCLVLKHKEELCLALVNYEQKIFCHKQEYVWLWLIFLLTNNIFSLKQTSDSDL